MSRWWLWRDSIAAPILARHSVLWCILSHQTRKPRRQIFTSRFSRTSTRRTVYEQMSKASKHLRDCPATGRAITSRECGEGRHSQLHCPAECPHNPFSAANYDQFGEIEGRLILKT